MVQRIIGSSVRFRLLVVLAAAALMAVGVSQLRKAPVDVLPEFTPPVVEVQTESLGLSAGEAEQLITVPMEQDLLNGVEGAKTISSHSVPGMSSIDLVFDRGTDILRARQLVQERLTQAHALPNVSKPPQMLQPISSTNRVMMIGLDSRKLSPVELSVLARWTVRPRLLGLPGVANVAIWGQRDRQLQVLVDPQRLRARHVSVSQVISTVGNAQLVSPLSFLDASTPGTGGFIDGPNQRLSIRHVLPFGKPAALGQVPVEGTGGRLRVADVATVVEGHQPLIGDAVVRGGHGLLLVVEKLPGANTMQVTHEVQRAMNELRPGLSGVHTDSSVFRPATFIQAAMHNLAVALIVAGALIALALVALMRRWRPVLVSLIAIPLSLAAAALVLSITGGTINALVVAGLVMAVGVIVDEAIGDTQNLVRRLREARADGSDSSTVRTLLAAAREIRGPMGYATLILVLAVTPVLVSEGTSAVFVHPMVRAYALAVLASMAVALTVTPALSVLLMTRTTRPRESRLAARLGVLYEQLVNRAIRAPRAALIAVCAVGLVPLALIPWIGGPDRPTFKDRDLLIHLKGVPGMSLPEMNRVATRTTQRLRALPGISDAGADVGRAVTSDQVVDSNSGEIWLKIAPNADYDRTLARVQGVVHGAPGIRADVDTYEHDRSSTVFARRHRALDVRVFGEDYRILARKGHDLERLLTGIPGVRHPRVELPTMQPTLEVEVDLAAAARHQVKPGDVRRAAAILLSGITVGDFFEQQKVFEVVVRGVAATQASVDSVRNLLIDTPSGGHVRLGDVAHVRIRPNPVDIRHEAVSRFVDVSADVQGRDLGDVQRQVERRIRGLSFPLEYHAEVLKASPDGQTSHGRFVMFAIAAAIGMFLLLQAAFGSWRLASLVFGALPLALVGGWVVALATGTQASLGAYGGMLAVFGLALRQAIMLMARFQDEERNNGHSFGALLVLRGARERLSPTLMSTVATGLAMLPLVALGDVPGNEITQPMAEVILGGLVTTALLNLFVLPAAYSHLRARAPRTSDHGTDGATEVPPVEAHV